MRTLLKIVIVLSAIFMHYTDITYAAGTVNSTEQINLNTGIDNGENSAVNQNDHLKSIENSNTDFTTYKGGEQGIYNTLIRIARDLKNFFFIIAGLFFLILVIRLLLTDKTEEEVTNFKKGIIWISIGIIITQLAYYFVNILFDRNINVQLAENFINIILQPLINVLETATSFLFLAIMIYAFYRIISANGDEEKAKSGKMSVLYAAVGFVVVKVAKAIVTTTYGKTNCRSSIYQTNCVNQTNLKGFSQIIVKIIDWMNSFVGIVVIIMIIYAGFLIFTSGGDEEKIKKAKNIIIYIIVGLLVLVTNYLILTFFIIPNNDPNASIGMLNYNFFL